MGLISRVSSRTYRLKRYSNSKNKLYQNRQMPRHSGQLTREDFDTIPKVPNQLRACLVCSLLKNTEQFEVNGCENCNEVLGEFRNNRDRVYEFTSGNWNGMISLISPQESWVEKWQFINHCVPGCYAISVSGNLPKGVERELRRSGAIYRPRDRSEKL